MTTPQHLQRLSVLASRAFVESGLHGFEAEIVIAVDVSEPMAPMFISGSVQELIESLLALGMRFDDDGVVPAWGFAEAARPLGQLTPQSLPGWVEREVLAKEHFKAECRYAPAIESICKRYFPREWAIPAHPKQVGGALKRVIREFPSLIDRRPFAVFAIVITGGDCADPTETIRAIQRASRLPIFFQFAGISPAGIEGAEFAFLKRLDRLPNRWVDNCGFFEPSDFRNPAELFSGLLNEFPEYLQRDRVKDMLLPPVKPVAAGSTLTREILARVEEDDEDLEYRARLASERAARERRRRERAAQDAAAPPPRPAPPAPARAHRPPPAREQVAASVPRIGPLPASKKARKPSPMTRPYQASAPVAAPAPPRERAPSSPARSEPAPHQRSRQRQPGRAPQAERPTRPELDPAPRIRRPRSLSPTAPETPAARTTIEETAAPPSSPPLDDDAATRLARIRARRAARRARLRGQDDRGGDDPTVT